MRKPIAVLVSIALLAALAVPAIAVAKGGQGNSRGGGSQSSSSKTGVSNSMAPADHDAAKAERLAAKVALKSQHESEKALRATEKAARKVDREAEKAAREESRSATVDFDSDEPLNSVESSPSADETRAVSPGVSNAFTRITANLEKSVAKVADGRKKQLPPGLVRVWLKFAAWLGVDQSTIPHLPTPDPSRESSATAEPTATIDASSTPSPALTP